MIDLILFARFFFTEFNPKCLICEGGGRKEAFQGIQIWRGSQMREPVQPNSGCFCPAFSEEALDL